MSVTSAAALVMCVHAARLRERGWIAWAAAMAVFVSSLAVRGWPGDIAGGRATLLRVLSCATAVIGAAGIARRLRGGLTAELALDAVPTVMAVSALSLVNTSQPAQLGLADVVTHYVYPVGYALLLLFASELTVRVRRQGVSADLLCGLGFVSVAAAAMWVAVGLTLSASWIVTVPDATRSAGFVLIALGAHRMARRGASPLPQRAGTRVSLVPFLAVAVLGAIAVTAGGEDVRLVYPLCVIGFAGFVCRLLLDRRTMRLLLDDLDSAQGRYRLLVERLPLIVYEDAFDEHSTSLFISPQTTETLGYTPDEWYSDPGHFKKMLHPDDRQRIMDGLLDVADGDGGVYVEEYRLIAKDGRTVWIRDHCRLVRDAAGRPRHWHGFMQDITAHKLAEVEMHESDRRFREILERVNLIAVMLDRDGCITFANDHLLALTGWTREALLGRDWFETFAPASESARRDWFDLAIESGTLPPSRETTIITRDGEELVISSNDTLLRDAGGNVVGLTSISEDITERRRNEDLVRYLAHYDELTGLPNRTLFGDWLEMAIERCQGKERHVAVLYVAVDNFSLVNDSLGLGAGDELLRQFANRLRDAAFGAELVARQSGDEFLVLVADTGEGDGDGTHRVAEDVAQMAEALTGRLQHLLAVPFSYHGNDVYLTARAGIALYPRDGADREAIIRAATINRYRGRAGRRRKVSDLSPADELQLISRLHRAIEQRELTLHYQPVVDLHDGRPIGVEALLRWMPPGRDPIPPGSFVPVAERTGLIAPITDWVVGEVCAQTRRWLEAGVELRISFNFPTGLWDATTIQRLLAQVRAAGLDPYRLVMEVTESAAMTNPSETGPIVEMLREAGMPLAIDDFGTGYSSLSRLNLLQAATLKIDRSFVRDLPHDASSAKLTETIVQLARGVGMEPLAEGIETDAQRRFLVEHGCRIGQGYLFGAPAPPDEIEQLWRSRLRPAA
jgi:diguanylate cyclase (GGDEF)-like protein/PAS domain S-box-containing protein